MIPCDYCDAPARHFTQRGNPLHRSYSCSEHHERALVAITPRGVWTDPPLPGRSRFEHLRRDDAEELWREGLSP